MKNKKALLFCGLAIAGLSMFMNTTPASASGVAVTFDTPVTHLFTDQGETIAIRGLGPNTGWVVGKTINVNDETMYQVSTSEYVKASEVTFSDNSQNNNNSGLTVHTPLQDAPIFNDETNDTDGSIAWNVPYKVNRAVINQYGFTYYQVSAHGWVMDGLVYPSTTAGNVEYSADFNPISNVIGADEVRSALEDMGCDSSALADIPDTYLQSEYVLSNYAGHDLGDLYRQVSNKYPSIGGNE
ncbi:hypothetical protein [Companilactobacillus mishanensis]|uniref:Surface layer protein A domain-containing protein n=1 Tax=Companilactobacillus mishanensis TaxID=2486008 RepID=A0A5P0ZHW0_9LACO|nr:hypothetical protein [Companilactobacillus mishanensis]MQS52640.1 hypothetical protein [Companilactobacillus mishanensis]